MIEGSENAQKRDFRDAIWIFDLTEAAKSDRRQNQSAVKQILCSLWCRDGQKNIPFDFSIRFVTGNLKKCRMTMCTPVLFCLIHFSCSFSEEVFWKCLTLMVSFRNVIKSVCSICSHAPAEWVPMAKPLELFYVICWLQHFPGRGVFYMYYSDRDLSVHSDVLVL